MKNIHILPTDKQSRLQRCALSEWFDISKANLIDDRWRYQNIYITNSEEIKDGDWVYCRTENRVLVSNVSYSKLEARFKIILTTDPDLIKDGVQAIDDSFLEWFVKNPSCERVEVENEWEGNGTMFGFKMGNVSPDGTWRYKIILPQEEPKQIKCYCGHTITCDCEPLQERLEEPTEEAKQRAENYMSLKGALEPLQETLEEAAEKYSDEIDRSEDGLVQHSFIKGAKWQAERMYSELELEVAFFEGRENNLTFIEWFEQFKKKIIIFKSNNNRRTFNK
jgi:hypothetical protein